jgi:hypothetical protein
MPTHSQNPDSTEWVYVYDPYNLGENCDDEDDEDDRSQTTGIQNAPLFDGDFPDRGDDDNRDETIDDNCDLRIDGTPEEEHGRENGYQDSR